MSDNTGFWSSKPFVSYDGKDENDVRAEVEVVHGFGTVRELQRKDKTAKVIFQAAHDKYFPAGWLPFGQEAWDMIEKAEADGTPIYFRIEKVRRKGVDRTLPISTWKTMDENRENTNKSLAAVRFNESDPWTFNKYAVTNPKEDPSANSERPSALNMSDAELGGSKPAGGGQERNDNFGIESTPFYARNRDGGMNPGSYAVAVPLNLLEFVTEWDRNHDELSQAGPTKRVAVAKAMLAAANDLQVKIYDGKLEGPDLSLNSHTRARALVFSVIRSHYPISAEVVESKDSLVGWKNNIVEKALAMWQWSMKEAEHFAAE